MKNFLPVIISVLLISTKTFSQTDPALKFAETITQSGLKEQLSIIASAKMEGRETSTEGQRKAAAYIESQFKKIGLISPKFINNYQQNYPLYKDTLFLKTFKIGRKNYKFGTDYIVTPGSTDDNEFKSNKIVFSGYGISDKNYDDYVGKDVKGKVVAIFTGEPKTDSIYFVSKTSSPSEWGFSVEKKAILAKQKGAIALLIINPSMKTISATLAANSKKSDIYFQREKNKDDKKVPVVSIIQSLVKNIFGEKGASELIDAAKAGRSMKEFLIENKIESKLVYKKKSILSGASNVIGFIEGSDKKSEYVFITAHYDHLGKKDNVIYYGADDDGSGTVSVIEMAAAFEKARAAGFGPRRTIVFMTVSGEEEGLWGSEYYSDHPVFPLDSTTVDLNTDMIGRVDPGRNYGDSMNYIYVIGDDKLSTDLEPICTSVNKKYTKLELDNKFNDPNDPERIYYRSDHYNFARKGVPIVFYFDGIHKDYHKPTDTVDKINFDLMEKRARYIFLTAWDIANRDNMLKRDLVLPTE